MSEQILYEILSEIKGLNERFVRMEEDVGTLKTDVGVLKTNSVSLHAGQAELFQLVTALKHGQELTHAKLEALTLDVRRLEGNFSRMENKFDAETTALHGDIRLLSHRIADVEMDVERLKNR